VSCFEAMTRALQGKLAERRTQKGKFLLRHLAEIQSVPWCRRGGFLSRGNLTFCVADKLARGDEGEPSGGGGGGGRQHIAESCQRNAVGC